jgi:hypothetical protein
MKIISTTMLIVFFLLLGTPHALAAPYIISATAVNDKSITIQWRNNDIATEGFIVLRKEALASAFSVVDSVKSALASSYTDSLLKDTTTYVYRMLAFATGTVSDTSNELEATTFHKVFTPVFVAPSFFLSWNNSNYTLLCVIFDKSNCETGYKIFRQVGPGNFTLYRQILSTDPTRNDTIRIIDSAVTLHQWYTYRIMVYKSDDSLTTKNDSAYTYAAQPLQQYIKFTQKSEFPIHYLGWSAKAGDSIILKESPSPAHSYTAINVSDAAHPLFAGYIDSTVLLNYPLSSLIPIFMKYNIADTYLNPAAFVWDNRLFFLKDYILQMCDTATRDFTVIDTLANVTGIRHPAYDSTLTLDKGGIFYVAKLGTDSLLKTTRIYDDSGLVPFGYGEHSIAMGEIGNRFYKTIQIYSNPPAPYTSVEYLLISDLDFNPPRTVKWPGGWSPYVYQTGWFLTPTLYLGTNDANRSYMQMTACDPRNFSEILLYTDTVHQKRNLQNIIVDTVNRNVFLFFTTSLVIVGYDFVTTSAERIVSGVQPLQCSGLTVRPNPARGGAVSINFPTGTRTAAVSFFQVNGRLVKRVCNVSPHSRIGIQELEPGAVYIVRVTMPGREYATRLFVKK